MRIVLAMLVGLMLAGVARAADNYKLDPEHSTAIYKISHFGIGNAYGRFNKPTGTVALDTADATKSTFEITIQTENVDTGNAKRDAHLKSPDFFNAKQFPTITFKSTSVKAAGENKFEITGDLTLHGVTKSIVVPITKTGEGDTKMMGVRTGWEAQVDLKRSDFGMNGMQGPVGDDVHLTISFEAVKQ